MSLLWLWIVLALMAVLACWLGLRVLMRYVARAVARDPSLLNDPEVRMMMRFVRPR